MSRVTTLILLWLASILAEIEAKQLGVRSSNVPPTTGILIDGIATGGNSLILPPSVNECDVYLIWFNFTDPDSPSEPYSSGLTIVSPVNSFLPIEYIYFPTNVSQGFLEWQCDIPEGYTFQFFFTYWSPFYTVGPSSDGDQSCIGVNYPAQSVEFSSYIAASTSFESAYLASVLASESDKGFDPIATSLVSYPTIPAPTITDQALASAIAFDSSQTSTPSGDDSSSNGISSAGRIAIIVAVSLAAVLITLCRLCVFCGRRGPRTSAPARAGGPGGPGPRIVVAPTTSAPAQAAYAYPPPRDAPPPFRSANSGNNLITEESPSTFFNPFRTAAHQTTRAPTADQDVEGEPPPPYQA